MRYATWHGRCANSFVRGLSGPASIHDHAGITMTREVAKKRNNGQSAPSEFILARLGKQCWVVGYQGKLIAGAVLTSLPAAAIYASDIAHAFGRHNFLLTVVEAGRHVV